MHHASAAAVAAMLGAIAITAALTPQTAKADRFVPGRPPATGDLSAHVVFQLADCPSTLAFLEILEHPTLLDRIRLADLLLIGEKRDLPAAARALRGTATGRPLLVASATTRRGLRRLGFRRTPFLLVEDAAGVIRFASPVPDGPRELRLLHRSLVALADLERRGHPGTR